MGQEIDQVARNGEHPERLNKIERRNKMEHNDGEEVKPYSLEEALAHIKDGGILYVQTAYKIITITPKTLDKFNARGQWILKPEGNGFRMKNGKSSIYLFPGQLKYKDCKTPMAY